ncbi:glucuronoxylan 4-O-methyltransferase 1 isoform X2 [Jatropha curcas]|uniref:glucuronoxylan 4-O-methyltransferase 1 isoform X2 n=1 Tax=Jatropha curcas TaxID=180498 RepID=UPI0009D75B7C|nr:glucuronoxylan 4-O-methyltransferase 1 isoform X2 [Jatropha curcas]
MPPDFHYRSFASPQVKLSPPDSPESFIILPIGRTHCRGNKTMKVPGRKILPLLVFILSTISIFRLVRLATTTSSSTPPLPPFAPTLQHSSLTSQHKISDNSTILTKKEFKLLSNLIKRKTPCNLLIFGLEPEYLKLSLINSGGITLVLENDPDKISSIRSKNNHTRIYKFDYNVPAKKAYKLLKHARKSPACAPSSGKLQNSTCKLALRNLPEEVYKKKWDVVVVDGPSGHSTDAPGRMAAIYTASMIARTAGKNTTDVVVHDVDRTIEKWFSWEFLCDENLVSSKERIGDQVHSEIRASKMLQFSSYASQSRDKIHNMKSLPCIRYKFQKQRHDLCKDKIHEH